jgi:hypothetical protein
MADDDVDIKFGANVEGLEEGSERGKEAIEGLKERLDELKESGEQVHEIFETMLEAAGIEVGLDAIKEWIASSAELGEQLERTAAKLGITGEEASELMGVAKLTGTSFDGLQTAMARLQVGLATVGEKSSRTGEALRVLGIDANQMRMASVTGQIRILTEAISRFQDGATKTAAVQALGRSFVELLPMFDRGKEGLEELHAVLERTGAIMSSEMVEAFAKVNEHINEMKLAWQGLSNEIFDVVKGPIDAAIVAVTHFMESLKPEQIRGAILSSVQAIGAFGVSSASIFVTIRADIQQVINAFDRMGSGIASVSNTLSPYLRNLAELFERLRIASNFGMSVKTVGQPGAGAPIAPGGGSVQGFGPYGGVGPRPSTADDPGLAAALAIKATKEEIESYTKAISDLFKLTSPEGKGEAGAPKPAVPQMQLGGGGGGKEDHTARDNAEADAKADLEAWARNAQEKTDLLNKELEEHQITMAQWAAQTKEALGDEAQDVMATYAAELQTAGLTYKQIEGLKTEEAAKLKEIAHQIAEADDKEAKDAVKQWQTAGDQIASIMDSQVNGLLKGTESISTAFRNMAASIVEDLIKVALKLAAEAAAMEALSIATGGALGGFGSGGIGNWLAGALHFSEGTDYVPATGFHHLDRGEMVIPAHMNPNNPANSLGGGSFGGQSGAGGDSAGGVTHNHTHNWGDIHVHNTGPDLDPAAVVKGFSKGVRNGAHTGLKGFR